MMRSLNVLAIRTAAEGRVRTALSVLVVALGVAMMIATNGFANAIRNALPGADEGKNMGAFATGLIDMMLLLISIVIMLAAGFLIFNAFLMSVTERRQQIGMLRTLGMTRRQILRLIVAEGLLIGIAGTVLGVVAGPLVAVGLTNAMFRFGGAFFSAVGDLSFTPSIMILAAVLGLAITLISVLVPAWKATQVSPLAALRPQTAGGMEESAHRRAGAAIIAAVILMAFLLVSPPAEWAVAPLDVQLTALFTLIWVVCLAFLLPTLIESSGHLARRLLSMRWKATGRLIADNIERERQRVMLTTITLAIGIMMIISMTGVMEFLFHSLLLDVLRERSQRTFYAVMPFDPANGLASFSSDSLELPAGLVDEVTAGVEDSADAVQLSMAFLPELTAMMPEMFSYVTDVRDVRAMGDFMFTFSDGDWETAIPIMDAGCGILTVPIVATRHHAGVGDTITVQGKDGPVECTIAGLGTVTGWISIVSRQAAQYLDVSPPIMMAVIPRIGEDSAAVQQRLTEITSQYPGIYVQDLGEMVDVMATMTDSLTASMNGLLLLAIVAAALGVINTTMMNVHERRHELGLIRAVGATRKQIQAIVMGEAALMGVVGVIIGWLAGIGLVIIFVVTVGGNRFGVTDIAIWPTALTVIRPGLITLIVGLIIAPLISASAAWMPTRNILQGATINTLHQSS